VARVEITADGRVGSHSLQSSGNPEFDQAVRLRLDQAQGSRIPEPPEERRSQIYGNTLPISFVPPR
jgi:outer membrane biosynthesis protein TonB